MNSWIWISIYHFKNDKNWSRLITAIMDKSLEIHLHLWVFLSIHPYLTPPPPPPKPHKQRWTSASRIFSRVSTLYKWREGGRTARRFRKGCTVLSGHPYITENYEYCSDMSQGRLSRTCGAFKSNGGPQNNFPSIAMKSRNPQNTRAKNAFIQTRRCLMKGILS